MLIDSSFQVATLKMIKQCLSNVDCKFIYPLVLAKIYGTPKMHKLTDSDSFPKF